MRQLETLRTGFKSRFDTELTDSMIIEICKARIEEDKKAHLKSMIRDLKSQDLREMLEIVASGRTT